MNSDDDVLKYDLLALAAGVAMWWKIRSDCGMAKMVWR